MNNVNTAPSTFFGRLIVKQSKAILFLTFCLCLAGIVSALTMSSSVFPQTDFPRVVILIDNGVMPADQMMATVTRPVEEAMKDIPGAVNVRSITGRGSAEVSVFFDWKVDMQKSELLVDSRLSQIRSALPATATTSVHRLTFAAFPVMGLSLTSKTGRSQTDLWNIARYELKPRLLQVPGVARVDLVGGRTPEYHVRVDPIKLESYQLSLSQVSDALLKGNLISAAGLHDEDSQLFLTVTDARVKSIKEIEELVVAKSETGPIQIKHFAKVVQGQDPQFKIVTADGQRAVLLNIRSQPDGSTVAIANEVERVLADFRQEQDKERKDVQISFFYDQSLLVRDAVGSVWECIFFGLLLSVAILFSFLKAGQSWRTTTSTTLIAVVVIPVTVLAALTAMKLLDMSFNLMTLGGIAAAIGLVIDDAIVVIENIATHVAAGMTPLRAVERAGREVTWPLIGSTLTPVVVFIPLAFIDGVGGVFFRALAITMVVSLLTSLLLAVTLTPTLAARFIRTHATGSTPSGEHGGPILRRLVRIYERAARWSLRYCWFTLFLSVLVLGGAVALYYQLKSDFLPEMDEGAFVLDYKMPPGTALEETDRVLRQVEEILKDTKEVESYSRRTGAQLGLTITEPYTGDFLIKLKNKRQRSVEDVKKEVREKVKATLPTLDIELAGILNDLIGDLTSSPRPIEIKIFSTDAAVLKKTADTIKKLIEYKDTENETTKVKEKTGIQGIVDVEDGLVYTGSAQVYRVRWDELLRYGLKSDDVARALNIALLGETPSSLLEGDKQIFIRVLVDPKAVKNAAAIDSLLVRAETGGAGTRLSAVTERKTEAGQLELRREDLRQCVAVTARTQGIDLGTAIRDINAKLDKELKDRTNFRIEYGGLYKQQQDEFKNLLFVMVMAVLLIFLVLLIEFRSLLAPVAILWGAVLSLFGVIFALWITGTSLNIISYLGAIIGLGIVAKNGILMLDGVEHLRADGLSLFEALIKSGRRRLRPVLMTSLAAALGMLPLAVGVGSGADMLKPLAIAVMGALAISVLFSLLATPILYYVLSRIFAGSPLAPAAAGVAIVGPGANGRPVESPAAEHISHEEGKPATT